MVNGHHVEKLVPDAVWLGPYDYGENNELGDVYGAKRPLNNLLQ
jgi:hypothetical protein